MVEIEIKYNPFSDNAEIKIDSEIPKVSSNLNKGEKVFQKWIAELPEILLCECNTRTFNVTFYGTDSDYVKIKAVLDTANTKGFKFNEVTFIRMVSSKDKLEKTKELLNKISLVYDDDDLIKAHIKNSNLNKVLQNIVNIVDEDKVIREVNNYLFELEAFINQELQIVRTQKELLISKLNANKQNLKDLQIKKTMVRNFFSIIINESYEKAKSDANKLIDGIVNELSEIAAKEIKKKSKKFYEKYNFYFWHEDNEMDIRTVELKDIKFLIKKISNTEKELEYKVALEISEIIKNKFDDVIRQYKEKIGIFDENLKVFTGNFKFADKDWSVKNKQLDSYKIKIPQKTYMQRRFMPFIPQPITPHNEAISVVYNEIKIDVLKSLFIEKIKLNSLVNKAVVDDFLLILLTNVQRIFDESLTDFDKKVEEITFVINSTEKEQEKITNMISVHSKLLNWITDIKQNIDSIINC